MPRNIDWEAVVADHGGPHSCTRPEDCYLVKSGAGPTVVLVGDSHAQMLEPMFIRQAREHGFSLAANMHPGCPWQANLVNYFSSPEERTQCALDRDGWYSDVLPKLHPDLVIVVDQRYDAGRFEDAKLERVGGSRESLKELLRHTTRETLSRFRDIGTRVLIVHNTIQAPRDPLECLAGATYIEECMVPAPTTQAASDRFYQAEDIAHVDVFTVDINPVICPDAPLCRPIVNGRIVWRDRNHLTARITVHLRGKIWDRIAATGALAGLGIKDSS